MRPLYLRQHLINYINEYLEGLAFKTGVNMKDTRFFPALKWRWGGKELDFFFHIALALYDSEKKEIIINRTLIFNLYNTSVEKEIIDDFYKVMRNLLAEEYWHYVQDRRGYLKDRSKEERIWIQKEARRKAEELSGVSERRFYEFIEILTDGEYYAAPPEETEG